MTVADNGHVPWPRWASDYVTAHAPGGLVRMVRLAMMVCQRESDLVGLGSEFRERSGIWCRPRKTKKKRRSFHIPLTAADALDLDRWSADQILPLRPNFSAQIKNLSVSVSSAIRWRAVC